MQPDKTPPAIKLDERNHVEKPLLDQLKGLGWEVRDLDRTQKPQDSERASFTEVVMLPILRQQLQIINPWLEPDQIEEVIKQLTANFPSNNLLENNRHLFTLLQENTSISENRKTGEKSPTVKFVDFAHTANNSFIAICQFKIRILGTENHIIPDIVLFLNGLPVVVIECKSPKVQDAIPEAIDQLMRYSEQRGAIGEGSAPLFFYNQFIIATCRTEAKFGTITTHNQKYFYRWADPFPRTLEDLDHGASSPNDQQRLVAGMLDQNNLLEIIRNFTLFSVNDLGGGTFDVTIIKIENGNIIVVCTDGDHKLGGKDWDNSLLNYFVEEWCRQNNSSEEPLDALETLNDWSLEAEKAKKALTGRTKTEFNLTHDGQKARISLTREKFDELTENLFNQTIELTKLAKDEAAKRNVTKIDKILLVGGSTRMPQVATRLEKEFGIKPEFSDPDESVAKGAATYGFKLRLGEKILEFIADKTGKKVEDIDLINISQDIINEAQEKVAVEFNLLPSTVKEAIEKKIGDVSSRSFGIIAYKNSELRVTNLILKNDPLPAKTTQKFGTYEDNQTTAEITIVDNLSSDEEYDLPPASRELGKAELTIPPNLPKGTPIEITYELNEQGRLQIHAKELVGGNEIQIEIETEAGASEQEIKEAKSRNLAVS